MSVLDEWQQDWKQGFPATQETYTQGSLQTLIKTRVRKHLQKSMQYFWASFALQILVYALLSHVIVKQWGDWQLVLFSLAGILLYVPFTVVLLRKFKQLALGSATSETSVYDYVQQKKKHLNGIFTFKRRYEWVLIPLSSAIGVFLVFALYVPGGITAFPMGAAITYGLTLLSCYVAIRSENKKSFIEPLAQLQQTLDEYQKSE